MGYGKVLKILEIIMLDAKVENSRKLIGKPVIANQAGYDWRILHEVC